jgi:hypothetical protein
MKLIKTERFSSIVDVRLNESCECWDLGNKVIANIFSYDNDPDNIVLSLHDRNDDARALSPAEREIKEEKFAREIQKKVKNIKIECVLDGVYMCFPKNQLMDVLTEIEQHINNQH